MERPATGLLPPNVREEARPEGRTASNAATSEAILEAAVRILATQGFQRLTARNVAEAAGTNLALINYYFGGKKGLLLAVYESLERQRFVRQAGLYDENDSRPLSAKWRQAIEFYRADLADGFVRVHHELLTLGFSDADLAVRAKQRIANWSEMLAAAAERHLPRLGVTVPARLLVPAFAAFWYGMEQQHLIGVDEETAPYLQLLDGITVWLEERERQLAAGFAPEGA